MLCSYYAALPLTLLPSSTWQNLDALAHQGPRGAAEWDPSLVHLAQALKELPGSMSALQALVSSCMIAMQVHTEMPGTMHCCMC